MLGLILVIAIVVILFGGLGPWSPRGYGYGFGHRGVAVLSVILAIVVVLLLMGKI